MANRHMKRCWAHLIIRETVINAIMRYPLTPVRTGIIKKTTHDKSWVGCAEKGTLIHYWWKWKLVWPLRNAVCKFIEEAKNRPTLWPSYSTSGYLSEKKKKKRKHWKDMCTPKLTAPSFTVAKICKQPKCPSTDEWIKM